MDYQEGISTIDAPEILATLYPALFDIVHAELRMRGRSSHLADDLVQSALTRWLELATTEKGAEGYLRRYIQGQIKNLDRPGRDASSHDPLSLEELSE